MTKPCLTSLQGLRVLVVEDEYLVASDLSRTLQAAGADVLGPVPTVADALSILHARVPVGGAVLDINLRGEMSFPVADALMEQAIRFVFATGYDSQFIPDRYAHVPRCQKPVAAESLRQALRD